ILRSEDGVNWTAIPQDPGTFLGDIVKNSPSELRVRGFRSLQALDGKLFATASDFRGVGFVIVSDNPAAGNDAWQQASPSALDFPVWTLKTFNGYLYATTGDSLNPIGYGVYKTDAQGSLPYSWIPIVTAGAFRPDGLKSPNGLSLWEFQGKLYVGTNRPIEMIRIDKDDHWEVVVGEPRVTPEGLKTPLSGLGNGFANFFNGHFWRMASHDDHLFVGTWNWSVNLGRLFNRPSAVALIPPGGFDFYNTPDGVHWSFLSRNGFNDPINYGVRSLKSTPFGIFMGAARLTGGAPLFQDSSILDFDEDGDIDMNDVNVLMAARNQPADGEEDPRDIDRDGTITVLDVRKLMLMCTKPQCAAINSTPELPAPKNVESVSFLVNPSKVTLSWEPTPGAVKYHIYRATVRPILDYFLPTTEVPIPGTDQTITIQEIINGALDGLCSGDAPTVADCSVIQALQLNFGLAEQFKWIGETTELFFEEPVPTGMQSVYFVQAEDSDGRLSTASNIVGGPSKSAPETLSSFGQRVASLVSRGRIPGDYGDSLVLLLTQIKAAVDDNDIQAALTLAGQIETSIEGASGVIIEKEVSQELLVHAKRLTRNIWLISEGVLVLPTAF
ncbi:MAG TPA: hypothetical protein VKZ59_06115, partial [Acidobacteriota bacterium]|nr:hypothetical protein [Acidobacteriota bacterium]